MYGATKSNFVSPFFITTVALVSLYVAMLVWALISIAATL